MDDGRRRDERDSTKKEAGRIKSINRSQWNLKDLICRNPNCFYVKDTERSFRPAVSPVVRRDSIFFMRNVDEHRQSSFNTFKSNFFPFRLYSNWSSSLQNTIITKTLFLQIHRRMSTLQIHRKKSADEAKSILRDGLATLESLHTSLASLPYSGGANASSQAEAAFVSSLGEDVEKSNEVVDNAYNVVRDALVMGCEHVRVLERFIGLHVPQMGKSFQCILFEIISFARISFMVAKNWAFA